MGRLVLVARLAARDLRRRPSETALLLLAIMGTTTTLTLGLALRGVTEKPYENTRAATAGPDVVVGTSGDPLAQPPQPADASDLEAVADMPSVIGRSGPFPVARTALEADGQRPGVLVEGRGTAPAAIDQPAVKEGGWVDDGGVVVEAAFADALGLDVGETVVLDGQSFRIAGIAVTAAAAPYPALSCLGALCPAHAGLVWLTQDDFRGLGVDEADIGYVLNLRLRDPTAAPAFVAENTNFAPHVAGMSWQDVRDDTADLVRLQRRYLLIGSRLIGLLALASVAVLVGGRMADQTRRVGLLKAVGGTPGLVAAVLLAEYVVVALVAATAGLAVGALTAPLLADLGAGMLGRAGTPPLTLATIGQVTAVALGVAVVASLGPAVRAARTSTVLALADTARPPQRTGWLLGISARLPLPLLLGLRVAARRPRRFVLSALSILVTSSGIVAALGAHATLQGDRAQTDPGEPISTGMDRADQALLIITITLVALAAVNAVVVTLATVIDNRHSSALTRALGATPHEMSAGLAAAQLVPALVGALLGIPGGIALLDAVDPESATLPPLWLLLAVAPATILVVAALTAIPARIAARHSVATSLRSELV